jgi:hypothetical protein
LGQFRKFVGETNYKTDAEVAGSGSVIDPKGSWGSQSGVSWRNPRFNQTDEHPVVLVSWNDATAFCRWLGMKEENKYRLPSEAEWEYACRAGTTTRYYFGDDAGDSAEYAWYSSEPAKSTHPVGQKRPNAWGLCDMHGNAWEWCGDWYDFYYYAKSPHDDPQGAASGVGRVERGGGCNRDARRCGSATRWRDFPDFRFNLLGFRVACEWQPANCGPVQSREILARDQYVDLLTPVDLKKAHVAGEWATAGTGISSTAKAEDSRLMLPITAIGDYDLKVVFAINTDEGVASVIFPIGGHYCIAGVSGGGKNWHYVARTSTPHPKVSKRELHTLLLKVRVKDNAADVDALLDDLPFMRWQGDLESEIWGWKQATPPPEWNLPQPPLIGLRVNDGEVVFGSVQLRMVSGKAWWIAPEKSPHSGAVPANYEHDREVAKWVLSVGGGIEVEFADRSRKEVKALPDEPFRLTRIDLQGKSQVTDRDLACLRGLVRLERLQLYYTQASDETLKILAELPSLEWVSLFASRYTDDGIKHLGRLKKLTALSLEATQLTDVGLESLSDLDSLEIAQLGGTRITGAGFARFGKMDKLKSLWMGNTKVNDAGLWHISRFSSLEWVGLDATEVTDAGLEHLHSLSNLNRLQVAQTKVTARGLIRLHEALPECKFTADEAVLKEYNALLRGKPNVQRKNVPGT